MAIKHVLRGSVLLLLIYKIMRDFLDPCFGLQLNNDYLNLIPRFLGQGGNYPSSDFAAGQGIKRQCL